MQSVRQRCFFQKVQPNRIDSQAAWPDRDLAISPPPFLSVLSLSLRFLTHSLSLLTLDIFLLIDTILVMGMQAKTL